MRSATASVNPLRSLAGRDPSECVGIAGPYFVAGRPLVNRKGRTYSGPGNVAHITGRPTFVLRTVSASGNQFGAQVSHY